MKHKILYDYDENNHIASVIIRDKYERVFYGQATAHPNDFDLANEKTGLSIANARAQCSFLHTQIQDLRAELKALKHLENNISQSSQCNIDSYEYKMLKKHIATKEKEIKELQILREELREDLCKYIQDKEKFYEKIRKTRMVNK